MLTSILKITGIDLLIANLVYINANNSINEIGKSKTIIVKFNAKIAKAKNLSKFQLFTECYRVGYLIFKAKLVFDELKKVFI